MSIYFFELPPSSVGTTITRDFVMPSESRGSVIGRTASPAEESSTVLSDRNATLEFLASTVRDVNAIWERVAAVTQDLPAPLELFSNVQIVFGDAASPFEVLASAVKDNVSRLELLTVVIKPLIARIELPSNVFKDGVSLLEFAALLSPVDVLGPFEIQPSSLVNPTLRYADRVAETVTAPAGGNNFGVSIAAQWQTFGSSTGYQTFANIPGIAAGDRVYVAARDNNGNAEISFGTWFPGTLQRTQVLASSNNGSLVTFSGPVTVICDVPALFFNRQISQKQVAATGNSQQTAAPLTAIDNIVTSASAGANDVVLDATFDKQVVVNAATVGQLNVDVWPPIGHRIDGLAANVSQFVGFGNAATFYYQGGGVWNAR